MSIYLKISWVGRDENLFIFFQNGDKNCRVGPKNRVGQVSGNTAIFFFRPHKFIFDLFCRSKKKMIGLNIIYFIHQSYRKLMEHVDMFLKS